jgi:hypothetical protein
MTLDLTDVSGLTIDDSAARLPTGTITVTSDGPSRLGMINLPPGTGVYEGARRVALARRSGAVGVSLGGGRTVLVLRAPFGVYSCARPSGHVTGTTLGPVRLGMTRTQARRRFTRVALRGRRYMDFFCPSRQGIRVGYASPRVLRRLPCRARTGYRGRAVLILTADKHFALRGVHPDTRLARVARRLHIGRGYSVGRNTWYLFADGRSRGVFKVRRGTIEEIGIASPTLTRTRRADFFFLRSFF